MPVFFDYCDTCTWAYGHLFCVYNTHAVAVVISNTLCPSCVPHLVGSALPNLGLRLIEIRIRDVFFG